jgi:hypothetical protein
VSRFCIDEIAIWPHLLRMDERSDYTSTVGRKPIISKTGKSVKPYTVKLFEDQVEYLQKMGRGQASTWVRRVIAAAMKRRG